MPPMVRQAHHDRVGEDFAIVLLQFRKNHFPSRRVPIIIQLRFEGASGRMASGASFAVGVPGPLVAVLDWQTRGSPSYSEFEHPPQPVADDSFEEVQP